jgi:hypothetical protein
MAIDTEELKRRGWQERRSGLGGQGPAQYLDPASGVWSSADAAIAHVQRLDEQGLTADGSQKTPERESLLDPATGLLKAAYQYKGQTIDPNNLEGYSAIKGDALRTGPSKWLTLAEQKQQAEQAQANDAANSNAMSGNAQARSTLAMRGGLSAGARERLGSQMQKDIVGARQQVAGQGILQRAQLNLQDEQMRRDSLNNFASAEGKLSTYNNDIGNQGSQFNILQALGEKSKGDDDAMNKWKIQMEKWAANKQADATANSGGGGK